MGVRTARRRARAAPIQQLIGARDAHAWDAALVGLPHLHAHGSAHARAMARASGNQVVLYVCEATGGRIVCPVMLRPCADGFDLTTPLGFAGFAGAGHVEDFAALWRDFWTERDCVAAYVQLNPLLDSALIDGPLATMASEALPGNPVHLLDLRPDAEALFAGMGRDHRSRLRGWHRDGGRYVEAPDRLREAFLRLYPAFAERTGVSAAYRLDADSLALLLDADSVLLTGAEGADGEVEAVSMFTFTPYGADYFLNAATPAGRRHARALVWRAIEWLKAAGVPCLNLGGGIRPDDALARFKARFGGVERPFLCFKQIFDKSRYARLCADAGRDPAVLADYFPAYRGPATKGSPS